MKTGQALIVILAITVLTCARITSPTGGPKDNTPPQLITSVPRDGQTQYTGKTILLQFDEAITTKAIEGKLIVTPLIQGTFKVKVRRNTVLLSFDSAWAENTTYTLNFGNTIQDLNESNIPKNLYLSFATGNTIDSLSISGVVKNLYTVEPVEDALVSIYPITDSLNITSGAASYFTKTDSAGQYTFKNLPSDKFYLYSVQDKNNNFKADTEKELYGFLNDTIDTRSNPVSKDIYLQALNTTPLAIKSARHSAQYFEITFNKSLIAFEAQSLNQDSLLHIQRSPELIRFYNLNESMADSIKIVITANDSINSNLNDTLQLYFRASDIPYEDVSTVMEPSGGSVLDTINLALQFNKPIRYFNSDSVLVQKDTITLLALPSPPQWNKSRTRVEWKLVTRDYIQQNEKLNLRFKKGSFITIENDTVGQEQKIFQITKGEDSGLIKGTIISDSPYFIIQLLSSQGKLIREARNTAAYSFGGLNAGNYEIRVITDDNNNGRFDIGNILTRAIPETIIYYRDPVNKTKNISVKKNWEVSEIDVTITVNK